MSQSSKGSSGGAGAQPPPRGGLRPGGGARQAAARAGGPALEAMYQLLLWLIPTLEKFPRSQKFLLGDRLQSEALAVLDSLISATYTREREPHLRAANLGLEKLRFGVRLSKDLRHLDLKAYEHAARVIDEVGRMVGGWIKRDRAGGGRGGVAESGAIPA
jgi:hypothetical protein